MSKEKKRPRGYITEQVVSNARHLSYSAYKVYTALCAFRNERTTRCWPGLERLCKLTGLSKPTVIKARHELEAAELVVNLGTWLPGSPRKRTNTYKVRAYVEIELVSFREAESLYTME